MRLRPSVLRSTSCSFKHSKIASSEQKAPPCRFTFQECLSYLKVEHSTGRTLCASAKHDSAVLKVAAHTLKPQWLKNTLPTRRCKSQRPYSIPFPSLLSTNGQTKLNFQTGEDNKLTENQRIAQLLSRSPSRRRTWEAGRASSPASPRRGLTNSGRGLRRQRPHPPPPTAPSRGRFRRPS